MAVLPLAKVMAGMAIRASAWNKLIDALQDVTVGHTHTGTNSLGARVSHGSLTDGAIGGQGQTHAQLDAHVALQAGAHGLPVNVKPQGVNLATPLLLEYGSVGAPGVVTTTLSTLEGVVVTGCGPTNDWPAIVAVKDLTNVVDASTFTIIQNNTDPNHQPTLLSIFWLAWGTK